MKQDNSISKLFQNGHARTMLVYCFSAPLSVPVRAPANHKHVYQN